MAYQATVYRVLIASPSDVERERDVIEAAIHAWNNEHSMDRSVVFLPVRWERASPRQGVSGQDVINEDLVATCDVLIGVFWTRLGSPTANDRSGTVEEIRGFAHDGRPAGLFFKKANMPMSHDSEQYQLFRDFENEVKDPKSDFRGLSKHFRTAAGLREAVGPYLTDTLRGLSLGTVVAAVVEASAQASISADAVVTPGSKDDLEDKPGLVEVLPIFQESISEIWTRLAALDDVGRAFRDGPSADGEESFTDEVSTSEAATAVFTRAAAWISEGAIGIETQLQGMRDAWARLLTTKVLFDRLLPFETPEDRQLARDLLATVPGLQDHFLGMVADFARARVGLGAYEGKSADLNRSVHRCDRALRDAIDVVTEGQSVAKYLSDALDARVLQFDEEVLFAAVRVALRSGVTLMSTRDIAADFDIARRADPEIRRSLDVLLGRGLMATVLDQGDAGVQLRLTTAGLDYALPIVIPSFDEQVGRIRRVICDLKEATSDELSHTGLSRIVIEHIALTFERQGFVRTRRYAEGMMKMDLVSPELCK